jgi:hypothetical protein
MNHWDARAEALLTQARSSEQVPVGAMSRVKASVMTSIALSAAAGASASVMATPTALAKLPAAVKAASSILPVAAAAAGTSGPILYLAPVTVGIALGLSAISPSQVVTTGPLASLSGRAPVVKVPSASPRVTGMALSPAAPIDGERGNRPQGMSSAASPAKSGTAPSSLAEEATLIEHARLVLRQGDFELTLRLLDQHRQEFPNGVLFFEALATRAVALCRQGKTDEGMQILGRLEANLSGSGMLAQVRRSCNARKVVTE